MASLTDILKSLQQRATPYSSDLGPGGPAGLRTIVGKYFLPELGTQQGVRGQINQAFLDQALTPGALYGAASTAATGYANELFAPGGQVSSLISKARGNSAQRGFSPSDTNTQGILGAATKSVGDVFAQQAASLESNRFSALAGGFGQENALINDLLQSLYTGVAGSEQLGLAQNPPRQKFLGIF